MGLGFAADRLSVRFEKRVQQMAGDGGAAESVAMAQGDPERLAIDFVTERAAMAMSALVHFFNSPCRFDIEPVRALSCPRASANGQKSASVAQTTNYRQTVRRAPAPVGQSATSGQKPGWRSAGKNGAKPLPPNWQQLRKIWSLQKQKPPRREKAPAPRGRCRRLFGSPCTNTTSCSAVCPLSQR